MTHTDDDHRSALAARLQICQHHATSIGGLVLAEPAAQQHMMELQHRLAAIPPFPGFIDALQAYPHSGIVNDASLPMKRETLEQQQGLTDDSDVALGLEVMAFLLYGEHRYDADIPARPSQAWHAVSNWPEGGGLPVSEHPQNRRRQYLGLLLEIATADAAKMHALWQKQANAPQDAAHLRETLRLLAERQLALLRTDQAPPDLSRRFWTLWIATSPAQPSAALASHLDWLQSAAVPVLNTETTTAEAHREALIDLLQSILPSFSYTEHP
jgi:hypothetical protein